MTFAWALPFVIVMQTRTAGAPPRPVAWAAQSPRPIACQGAPGLWEVSRQTLLARRCRELSRSQALLTRAPTQARERAAALLARDPGFVEARVLRGRASLRLGDGASALADLLPLLAEAGGSVADPAALLDGGRAALAQSDWANAGRFYRTLGSRAALLPDRAQQVVAYIEIAATLLVAENAPVDDVLAYLHEARRRSPGSGFSSLCGALSGLSWVVAGREAEAQGVLSEVTDLEGLGRFETHQDVWLPEGLFHALMGLVLERERADLSVPHYEALARSPLAATRLGKVSTRARSSPASGQGQKRSNK